MTSSPADRSSTGQQPDQFDQEAAADLEDASAEAEGPMVGDDPVADDVVRAEPDPVEPPD